jgi:hypothetical protein
MDHHNYDQPAQALARGLGWFSLALGLTELLRPRRVRDQLGMPTPSGLVRSYGLREIASGVAILASRDPTPWLWARVAGDVLDMATLAPALRRNNPRRPAAATALMSVLAITALDVFAAMQAPANEPGHPGRRRSRMPVRDYSDRSGFPHGLEQARAIAARRETQLAES